jgi:hypothetical protein
VSVLKREFKLEKLRAIGHSATKHKLTTLSQKYRIDVSRSAIASVAWFIGLGKRLLVIDVPDKGPKICSWTMWD